MARSISKGPFVDGHLISKVDELNKKTDMDLSLMLNFERISNGANAKWLEDS